MTHFHLFLWGNSHHPLVVIPAGCCFFRVDRMGRMGIADFQTKPPTPRIHKNHRLYSTQCLSAFFEAPRGSFATLKPDDLQRLKQMSGSTAPVMSDGFSFSSHLHLGSWAHRTSWHQRRWNEEEPMSPRNRNLPRKCCDVCSESMAFADF